MAGWSDLMLIVSLLPASVQPRCESLARLYAPLSCPELSKVGEAGQCPAASPGASGDFCPFIVSFVSPAAAGSAAFALTGWRKPHAFTAGPVPNVRCGRRAGELPC